MSEKIRFKIDEKSLFRGVLNDYDRGQTPTVSTPINQSNDPEKWRNDILELRKTRAKITGEIPDMMIRKALQHSKADCKITDIFVFENILLDGKKLDVDCQFAMYIKEEIEKYKEHGKVLQKNIHFGRLKLHYPISYEHKSDNYNIDNSKILSKIIKENGGFAYVVRGFEYFEESNTLNFITSLLGPEGINLTTVFRRKKGVGKKLTIDPDKVSEQEYIYLIEQNIETGDTITKFETIAKTRRENGKLGEEKIYSILFDKLTSDNELYHTSLDFPQSPYDMEYIENGVKKYVEVKSTSGEKPIFYMSSGEIKFMETYKENYFLYLVTSVKDEFPEIKIYRYEDIIKMKKEYPTTLFFA